MISNRSQSSRSHNRPALLFPLAESSFTVKDVSANDEETITVEVGMSKGQVSQNAGGTDDLASVCLRLHNQVGLLPGIVSRLYCCLVSAHAS